MQYRDFGKRTEQYEKESKESRKVISKGEQTMGRITGKAGLFCNVGTSDQDTDRGFESSFAGRKGGCGSMPTGII